MPYTPTPGLMRRLGFQDITTDEELSNLNTSWCKKVQARELRYVLNKNAPIPDVELVVNLNLGDGYHQLFEIREIEDMGSTEFDKFIGYMPSEAFFLQLLHAVGWPAVVVATEPPF